MFLGDMHNLVYQMILLASIHGLVALGRLEGTVRQNKLRGTIQHKSLEEESMIQHRDLWEGDIDLGFLVGKDQEGLDSSHGSHRNDAASTAAPILAAAWDRVVPVGGSRDPHDQQSHNDSFAYHSSGFKPRVVGGQDSELQSFAMHLKWDDTIQEWKFAGCGGTLISECHILTAAHCVTFPRKHTTEAIYINAWRPFHNNSDGIVTKPYHLSRILPEKTVVHEGFQNQNNFNDIAILTLETCASDFDVMRVASPAVEQDVAIQNGVTTRVAGFGQISPVNAATPDVLQSVEVTYIEGTDCEHQYYPLQIQPDMYCAGFATGGKDSCNGDSGGPSYVVDPVTQQTIQIGIVSWGISCAKEGHPGVYVSTAYHYDWIKRVVCSHNSTQNLDLCLEHPADAVIDRTTTCRVQGQQCGLESGMNHGDCCVGMECHHRDNICAPPSRDERGRVSGGEGNGGAGAGN